MTLEEKRRRLDSAIMAIAEAECHSGSKPEPDSEAFQKIIEAIHMQTNTDWTKKYYNEEAQKLIETRRAFWNPELQKQTEEAWASLYKDIESAAKRGIDPASAEAQALADRHAKLIESFTGGHASIDEGLKQLYADRQNWPEEFKKMLTERFAKYDVRVTQQGSPSLLSPEAEAFFQKVKDARNAA
jgi:hypothetical protein